MTEYIGHYDEYGRMCFGRGCHIPPEYSAGPHDALPQREAITMSHFYGTLQGQRGEATRCGTKASGITTQTASWEGAVGVWAWHDEKTGVDMVEVSLITWHGAGSKRLLYRGPISGMQPGAEVK